MKFVKEKTNTAPLPDNVFAVTLEAQRAKKQYGDLVVDATIGSLYEEDGTLATYDLVYQNYDTISPKIKAAYASAISGDTEYKQAVYDWVVQEEPLRLAHEVIATPGGTGAISLTLQNILNTNETVLLPDLAWSSYRVMAECNQLKVETYTMFEEDHFNISSFCQKCQTIMEQQGKLLVIINDPCHNPSGYSLSINEWQEVIDCINTLSKQGPCILLNDIAYMDYSYQENARSYLSLFNQLTDNVAVIIAFSCSKSLTAYGMRCGAAVILSPKTETVSDIKNVFERNARALWSNVNNGWMKNFAQIITMHKTSFVHELQTHVQLLKKRSTLFLKEAKACALPLYPYKEGFFVTIVAKDPTFATRYHQALKEAQIYTVQIRGGIRVALCSVPYAKIGGLAKRMKEIYRKTEEGENNGPEL